MGTGLGCSSPVHDDGHNRNEVHPHVQGGQAFFFCLHVAATDGLGGLLPRIDSIFEAGDCQEISKVWSFGCTWLSGNTVTAGSLPLQLNQQSDGGGQRQSGEDDECRSVS